MQVVKLFVSKELTMLPQGRRQALVHAAEDFTLPKIDLMVTCLSIRRMHASAQRP